MKFRVSKRILSLFLILVMISSYGMVASGVTSEELQSKESTANDMKANYQKQIDELSIQLEQLAKETKDIQSYIVEVDKKMQTINNSVDSLNNQINQKQTEINNNQVLLEQTKQDLQQQYESMKLRIQYMYEHQTENYIAILLQSADMADMLNKAEYINKITDYDREALMKYAETEKKIQDTQVALVNDQKQLEDSLASVELQKKEMELVQKTKNDQLALLKQNSQLTSSTKSLAQKGLEEQEDIIKSIENERSQLNQKPYTGKFLWPVPASHRITSIWGELEDRLVSHNGVDIGASNPRVDGDQIIAAEAGEVVIAGYSSTAGNWIWIDHGNGVFTVYMHASKIFVAVEDSVTRGQVIALMGNTGNSNGTHLHFGVREGGRYVDPNKYINYMQYYKK